MITAATVSAPKVDYLAVTPMLVVFGAAVLGVLVEAFVARRFRWWSQVAVAGLGLATALGFVIAYALGGHKAHSTLAGAVVIDKPTLFLQGTVLALALLSLMTVAERDAVTGGSFTPQGSAVPGSPDERAARQAGLVQAEIFPLLMFSVGGMLVFPAAGDLLTMFVGLEVLSLPLYLLCGLARRRRLLSQEASLKYFLLGAFSSAFFLYGAALLYGYAGSVRFTTIAEVIGGTSTPPAALGQEGLLLAGAGLVLVGLLFKVGAAPFHNWTPDVYQGAPTPITGFMAACTKVAAFGALLRLVYVALRGLRWNWQPSMMLVAILTMIVGSVVAIVQADVKRMLAYSSIAHAGFLLVGIVAMDRTGLQSVLFYLVAYGFTTIGAFTLITLVRSGAPDGGVGGEATHLSEWQGLGRRNPWTAAAFTLFLLAFAGIPLTSGFIGKYAVFSAALGHVGPMFGMSRGAVPLVVVGVLASVAAAFFYVRVIVLMYFGESTESSPTVVFPGVLRLSALSIAVLATLVLGVFPSLVLHLAGQSATFLP